VGDAITWSIYFVYYFPITIPLSIYHLAKEAEEERMALAKEAEEKRVDAGGLPADRAQLADIERLMQKKRCPATLPASTGESNRLIADLPMVDCRVASCDKLAYTRRVLQVRIASSSGADVSGHQARLAAVEEAMQDKGCSLKSPDAKEQPAGSNACRSLPD
jgi:hypothetical protein